MRIDRGIVMDDTKPGDPLPHQVGTHRYSVAKALRQIGESGGRQDIGAVDGLEREVHEELTRRGLKSKGLLIPMDARVRVDRRVQRRSLDTTAGAGSIATILDEAELIDVLRARLVTAQLGARTVEIEAGTRALPRKTATGQPSWVTEDTAPGSETNLTADAVKFTAHTLTGFTDATRRFDKSAGPAGERIIAGDLMTSLAVEVDRVALNGSNTAGQPTGLLANPSVPTFPLATNGASVTLANLCAIEAVIGNANADAAADASLGWCTTPNARSKLRQSQKTGTSAGFLWDDDDRMLGKPAMATSNLPSNLAKGTGTGLSALIFGNWADLVIGHWGAVDVLVNRYLQSVTGSVRFRAYLDCDVQVRHGASFLAVTDVSTT